ncbi:MAG: tyrosine-protein phosphatase [Bacteroidota bacterium]
MTERLSLVRDGDRLLVKTNLEAYQIHQVNASGSRKPLLVKNGVLDLAPMDDRSLLSVSTPEDTFFVMERHFPDLDGPHNLRDLGGLFTEDGYQVQWGKLFRSDKLSEVSKEDHSRLAPLDLHTIVDFRLPAEVGTDPDRWPGLDNIAHVSLAIGDTTRGLATWLAEIKTPDFDPDTMMYQVNDALATTYAPRFREFSEMLLTDSNYPLLFHCTAGKDRTGFAAAIILMALGVDRQTIMNEYLMTNHYTHTRVEKNVRKAVLFVGLDAESIRPLMGVRSIFLQGAFDAIDEQFTSQEQFLCEAMGLCQDEIEQLKSQLLYKYGGDEIDDTLALQLRADEALTALATMDMKALTGLIHPVQGVRFSPYATVRPESDQTIRTRDLRQVLGLTIALNWGNFDATGETIHLLPREYFDRFVNDADYHKAEKTGWNERIGQGNSIHNIPEIYPEAQFIEYHFSGFDERYGGMDWKSLRLVFEAYEKQWYLVGVVHDQWTS